MNVHTLFADTLKASMNLTTNSIFLDFRVYKEVGYTSVDSNLMTLSDKLATISTQIS